MLKIGDFSKVCQVSIKALRHWDAIDLLKPAITDPTSGYRYYTIDQIGEVNRILAFRAMGLGLAQIADLLNTQPTTSDIRAMLHLKRAELQQQITNAAAMLRMVESRLNQIDHDGILPDYEVTLKTIPAQPALTVRDHVPTMNALVDLLRETYPYARARHGVNLFALFHDEGYEEQHIDVEIGFPVEGSPQPIPLGEARAMCFTELPPVELVATTIHVGEWLTLAQAYTHLGTWIEQHNYGINGIGREVFHHIDWEKDQKFTVTEIQFPVTARSS